MFLRFFPRKGRYIYPYCIYNVYIKLKYVVPSLKNATLLPTSPTSPIRLQRQYHITSGNFMNTPLDNNTKIDPNDPLVTKIRSEPEILVSIQEFSRLLQGKGVDLSRGQMPSMLQMAKLASDKEINAKITDINTLLNRAGITLDSQTIQKFMNLANTEEVSELNISQNSTQKTSSQDTPLTPKANIIEESKETSSTSAKAPFEQVESKAIGTNTAKKPIKIATTKITKSKQTPKESVGFIAKIKSWIFKT
ncbi:hypothetical protein RclHR1_00630026 [Rhizophagus clarus]|uniref:Uncharacterized protein n=1 Tax=Rhizophagus clarus TaxID=94130 RepID=A0A2Z6SIG7_9GLOM|nr:hypothetical protein RclHR1_00630026 [Rhizophagus clarus]